MTDGQPPRVGVLLAAGRSRRLGRPKQLVPWPSADSARLLVAAAFDAIAPACDEMVVVVDHEAERVRAALGARRFEEVHARGEAEMIESVRAGLRAVASRGPGASALVHPADHPAVAPSTLEALIAAHGADPARAVMPVYDGRGGHPVLIPPGLVAFIGGAEITGGLRGLWLEHPERCHRLAVNDPGVVRDLDTPDQLPPGV